MASLGVWSYPNSPHHSKSRTKSERCSAHRLQAPVRGQGVLVLILVLMAQKDTPTGGSATEVVIVAVPDRPSPGLTSHTELCPPAGPQRTARPTPGAVGLSVSAQPTAPPSPSGVIPGACSPTGPAAGAGSLQKTSDSVPGGSTLLRWLWPAQTVTERADGKDGHVEGPPRCLLGGEPPSGCGFFRPRAEGCGRTQGVGRLKMGSRGKPNPRGPERALEPQGQRAEERAGVEAGGGSWTLNARVKGRRGGDNNLRHIYFCAVPKKRRVSLKFHCAAVGDADVGVATWLAGAPREPGGKGPHVQSPGP